MADGSVTSPAPRRKRSWLRAIAWIAGVLIVLLVVVYFVATSSAFFKGVILPRVSAALNANVTVSDASISPFKQVVLRNLKVQTTGAEPLVTAPEARLHYSLMDIIGGNIHVDELTLASPTITIITNPDGTSNLDPLVKAQQQKPPEKKPAPRQPAKPSKAAQVDIKKIALTDASIRNIKLYQGGTRDMAELSHVNVNLDNVKNGDSGKLALSADISIDNNPPPPGAKGSLLAKLKGSFDFALSPDLKPASIQGNTRLEVTRAEGALAQAATLAANFDCNVTPTAIKQVALRFARGNTPLGELLVAGPFDIEKTEGRLNVQLIGIDKKLLNLAGASSGLDFGPTTINSSNEIQLAKAGALITTIGQFNLNRLQVTRTNQTTPPLDLRANYNIAVDKATSNAVINAFNLNGSQKGNPVLKGELTSPMTINWGNANNPAADSALKVAVAHLNLADWKPFLGDVAPAGDVNGRLQLLSQQAGKRLTFDLNSEIANLTAGSGSNHITQATVTLQVKGKATDLRQFNLSNYKFELAHQNQPLVTVSGAGTYDQANQIADIQLNAQVILARLLQALHRPDVNVSSGTAELKAHVTQKQKDQNVTGSFALANLNGNLGSNYFQNFGATADLDISMAPQQVLIRKLAGQLSQGQNLGGVFAASGSYDLTHKSAQLTSKLADFNQHGLGPFLQSMLADKKLVSVALNGNAAVQYDPQAASTIKVDLQLTNLVVSDPKGQLPATPLAATMTADVSLNKQIAEIRQFVLGLTPTDRAANQVRLSGRVDMSQTNAIQGNLKLAANSLDLTRYYDVFAGEKKTTEPAPPAAASPSAPQPAAPGPEKEPPAVHFPVRNFVADATIGRLYLHEIDITHFQATAKVDGGHVVLNPFKLALNGAPVSTTADLDLGVPGYKYALTFGAQAVPLAPLVNSLQPEQKGRVGGTFSTQANIGGAGTTGASLRKSLKGQFDAGATNLNLSIANAQSPLLKRLIDVVATIPELLRNPEAAASSLLGALGPKAAAGKSGGLANELSKAPIQQVDARGAMGNGQVTLKQAQVRSSAFQANATGAIALADVLTNSTLQIPVTIALSRPLADKLNLAAKTPTNVAYVKLPDFLTMRGTLGQPKSDVNKKVLAATAAGTITGAIPGAGKVGSTIKGIFGGSAPTPTGRNAPGTGTNQPPANQKSDGGFLNKLLKK